MEAIPLYADDLINQLDQLYPDRCPDMKDTEREIWFKAGQRAVINHLISVREFQKSKEKENEINVQ